MDEQKYKLINKDNPFNPEDYNNQEYVEILIPISDREIIDEDEIIIDENGKKWAKTSIEKDTYEKFLQLQATVKEKYGVDIEIIEAKRTLAKQQHYFDDAAKRRGEEYANNYVAKAGYSEHHTGRAFDYSLRNKKIASIPNPLIKKVVYKLAKPAMFYAVNSEAAKLGLLLRYPMFGKFHTGYKHERWHLSNVGDPVLASYLRAKNMPLEKFYANASKYAKDYDRFETMYLLSHPELTEDEGRDM